MRSWFTCKIKYHKEDEHGRMNKINEAYLFDALNYTEAEQRVFEELAGAIRGEFTVTNISKNNYVDVYNYDESEKWYKCKVVYKEFDERTEKEKKVSQQMLICADDLRQGYDRLFENLSEFLAEFEISSITETPLIDVYPYSGEDVPDNLVPLAEYEAKQNEGPIKDEVVIDEYEEQSSTTNVHFSADDDEEIEEDESSEEDTEEIEEEIN